MSYETNIASVSATNNKYVSVKLAFGMITSLFFLWGVSHGLLDVLNKHFQDSLNVTKAESGYLQMAYYGAYFLVAIPVGALMSRLGYKSGVIAGLFLFAAGALLFVPATTAGTFIFFIFSLFILACGLGCLETAANLYASVLGRPEDAERRLNFAQSFNGLGVFMGPIIGGSLFFAPDISIAGRSFDPVMTTYVVLALLVALLMVLFIFTRLPEIQEADDSGSAAQTVSLWKKPNFSGAIVAQFFYMAAHVGIASFFINFALDHWKGSTVKDASYLLSCAMLIFMVGRFASTWLMKFFRPRSMLIAYGFVNLALSLLAMTGAEKVSVVGLMAIFFFLSIMYPCIFAMGVKNLGSQTKRAGSYLVMTLVGGAVSPYLMGSIADHTTMAIAFIVPAFSFCVIIFYGMKCVR
ncbi:MFS transporter [Serratia ficaria]|uniref:MFS transporter n=1 Tax=Serratia ficaria TaxID=61651 RepID=UPI002177B7C0|nr:MFS transporter [Serratia ficaria]CAI0720615.1 L-fucose permease [Serratia ficaria]CAI1581628.1 L-fucose permease [Serratia ficaria]